MLNDSFPLCGGREQVEKNKYTDFSEINCKLIMLFHIELGAFRLRRHLMN